MWCMIRRNGEEGFIQPTSLKNKAWWWLFFNYICMLCLCLWILLGLAILLVYNYSFALWYLLLNTYNHIVLC